MNIVMISVDYPPTPGGISAHVHELSRALTQNGHKVSVVTRKKGEISRPSSTDGIDIYEMRLRFAAPLYGLQIRSFVKKLLPLLQPDLIHIHGMGPLEWYDITSVPLVYTNHTSGYLKRIQKGGWRRTAMLKRLFARPDLFLAPSRELLEIPFPIRAPKHFIANGVDSTKYVFNPHRREEIRTRLGLAQTDIAAILTRRLVDKNGVIYLAKAAKYLQTPELKFVLIGDGPERAAIEEEFHRNCGDRVIFLGAKTHAEIIDFYSAADFSILPSLMEATSISGLEAMACGLPLVGTKVGGIPELIKDGENGFLCEPAAPEDLAVKIEKLISCDHKSMGEKSRQMVTDHFDWQRIADKTVAAYATVLPE